MLKEKICEKGDIVTVYLQTGQEILDILKNKKVEKQKQEDDFREILRQRFDLKAIGSFALGRYRRQAGKKEKRKMEK
jgi:ABC-type transporter MlaC component